MTEYRGGYSANRFRCVSPGTHLKVARQWLPRSDWKIPDLGLTLLTLRCDDGIVNLKIIEDWVPLIQIPSFAFLSGIDVSFCTGLKRRMGGYHV